MLPAVRIYGTVFSLGLLLASGCGKKTNPLPPQAMLPPPIADLAFELAADGARLHWSPPRRTASGRLLTRTFSYQVLRAEVAAAEFCADCPLPYRSIQEIEDAEAASPLLRFHDPELKPGYHYSYRVQPRAGFFAAGDPSNIVSFWWQQPVAAPRDLNIEAGDGQLRLSWLSPAPEPGQQALAEPVEYEVLRSLDGQQFALLQVVAGATSYVDEAVRNRQNYFYQVRVRTVFQNSFVPGAPSAVVAASPRDLTPPPAPRQLRVVQTDGMARLIWNLVEAEDIKGYRIYRRLPDEQQPRLIGQVSANELLFVDRELPTVSQWYYGVSSFDAEDPPNESEAAGEVLFVPRR